jgi:glucose/mannose-6-phosphate isomerase
LVDPTDIRACIEALPDQLREGGQIGSALGDQVAMPTAVVLAGMGGSALGGELLRGVIAGACPVPMTRVRGFGVPSFVGPGTLVICVGYSGETAETLACARHAHGSGASVLAVGSGGTLGALASEWGVPFARVPGGLYPRAALGYLFGATAGALTATGLAPADLAEQAALGAAQSDIPAAERLGEELAHTIPLIYGAGPLAIVAYRWKTQLNENAKMHAFSHAFPEVAHNEIEGWAGAAGLPFSAVFLRDRNQIQANAAMMDAAQEMIAADASTVAVVEARGETPVGRAFSLVAQGDWVSYHAGLVRGVDPGPIARISELKARIRTP